MTDEASLSTPTRPGLQRFSTVILAQARTRPWPRWRLGSRLRGN